MSIASVTTMGYGLGAGTPGSASLVVTLGYGLAGVAPPPPPVPSAQRFGGGPFWYQHCDWTAEDERELRRLEKQERELEKRVAKAQRAVERASAHLPERTNEGEERRRIALLDERTQRINELAGRLDSVQEALERKRRDQAEAEEFFDCVATILMEEE